MRLGMEYLVGAVLFLCLAANILVVSVIFGRLGGLASPTLVDTVGPVVLSIVAALWGVHWLLKGRRLLVRPA